ADGANHTQDQASGLGNSGGLWTGNEAVEHPSRVLKVPCHFAEVVQGEDSSLDAAGRIDAREASASVPDETVHPRAIEIDPCRDAGVIQGVDLSIDAAGGVQREGVT